MFIEMTLRDKKNGAQETLRFETSWNPLKMAVRLSKIVNCLRKYDKTHDLVAIDGDDEATIQVFKKEIKHQEASPGALPEGLNLPASRAEVKRQMERLLKKKRV